MICQCCEEREALPEQTGYVFVCAECVPLAQEVNKLRESNIMHVLRLMAADIQNDMPSEWSALATSIYGAAAHAQTIYSWVGAE